jgi:hypothetical protein
MQSLKSLSDKQLLNRLSKLVKQEHNLTLEILRFIIEVENRKIYRSLGCSSMFVYCTEGLGYSESSAYRRICAARAIRKCPAAYDYLDDGRVSISNLAIVWKYITLDLLDEIAGKSRRQVVTVVARFEPRIKYPDCTRPVIVRQIVESQRENQPAGASSIGSCELALAVPEPHKIELGEKSSPLRR